MPASLPPHRRKRSKSVSTVILLPGASVTHSSLTVLLGDSITEITCWRPLVWTQLVTAGLASNVDFVGSQHSVPSNCSKPAGFDTDHEGHSGWQAYDIARNNIVGWVQNTKPDVVQFMLGTNDVNIGKRNVGAVTDAYTTMLKAMRAANPKVKVVVSILAAGKGTKYVR